MLRELGSNEKAAKEYQKAVHAEEVAFGRENPSLATLWRKLACLGAVMAQEHSGYCMGTTTSMDQLDGKLLSTITVSINQKNEDKHSVLPKLSKIIDKGDKHYKAISYHHAVDAYAEIEKQKPF